MKVKKLKNKGQRRISTIGWMFISVTIVTFLVFILYPVINSFFLSFHSVKGIVQKFNGINNYKRMFQDVLFYKALGNTFIYLIIQVPIMLTLGMFLATLLNSKKLRFKTFFRTAIFLPCVTSLVAYSVLFKMIFAPNGIINHLLTSLKIIGAPIEWLSDPTLAKVVIILALLWRWTGYNMIFYLAALQNVPAETYEAAEIDGASSFQQFFHITIPQLKPIILFTTIMSTIGTLQIFDEPMNLTRGGPGNATLSISQYIYNQSFVYAPNFGYAATLSYVVVFIVAILAIIQIKMAGEDS
jgi:lactose/L-arabinose transport system permease protein